MGSDKYPIDSTYIQHSEQTGEEKKKSYVLEGFVCDMFYHHSVSFNQLTCINLLKEEKKNIYIGLKDTAAPPPPPFPSPFFPVWLMIYSTLEEITKF